MLTGDGVDQPTHTNIRGRSIPKVTELIRLVDGGPISKVHVVSHRLLELCVCQVGEGGPDRKHRADLHCTGSEGTDVILLDGDTDGYTRAGG